MFKIKKTGTYKWLVKVSRPDDNGRMVNATFTAIFARLNRDDIKAATSEGGDEELVRRGLVGWEGVQDEDGEVLEFSDEARESICNDPAACSATALALVNSLAGLKPGN